MRRVFEDARARVLEVGREMMTRWRGPHDFLWRIKIKAIAHAHAQMPGLHVLYVDGDTFLYATLEDIKARLDHGTPYMHLPETTLA